MKKISTSAYKPTEIETENIGENKVRISVYPFEAGYAVTVAHPIRRLLYSSTLGFAPVAVKIDGVSHEFDSIRGMLEDVALFIINLKKIGFKIKGGEKRVRVSYSFSGPKEFKGEDLENSEIEVVNKDAYLATINEDAELNFSLVIEKGIGYVPSEDIREIVPEVKNEDFIALDAFFTPVKSAVYNIENMLVEDNPNFEKIVFEVETNGQIQPLDAFKDSLSSLYDQLSIFNTILNVKESSVDESTSTTFELNKLLQNITELGLSARSFNCLDKANIKYIGELSIMSEAELKSLKNLGKKSLEEISSTMEEIGFPIGYEFSDDVLSILKAKIEELKDKNKEES